MFTHTCVFLHTHQIEDASKETNEDIAKVGDPRRKEERKEPGRNQATKEEGETEAERGRV